MRRASLAGAGALLGLALLGVAPPTSPQGVSNPVVTSLTLFAGTSEGLFRSTDWSRTWKRVEGSSLKGATLEGMGAARAVLLGTTQVWTGGDGIYVSEDFGDTWAQRARTRGVTMLLPSRWPQSDPTLFAGTGLGLLRSRDGGKSFEATSLSCGAVHRAEWPGPALVVGCDEGLFVSSDEGRSFTGPATGLPSGPVRAMVLSTFFAADPVMFVGPDAGGVYRSADGGRSFSPAGLVGERVADFAWLGPFLYASADGGFFRSQDAGATWTKLSDSPGQPRRLLFPLAPWAGLEAFLATDRGLFHTPDSGEHWEASGFRGQAVLTVATFPPPDQAAPQKKRR